jgi:AmiR/NasT family two-component response regulator
MDTSVGTMSEGDAALVRALTDVAVVGIGQERTLRDPDAVTEQLRRALETRLLLEEAQGMLVHAHAMEPDQAFTSLRRYAREQRLDLRDVAWRVIHRHLDTTLFSASD